MLRIALTVAVAAALGAAALSCAQDGGLGHQNACTTAQATLLGCTPPTASDTPFTIEDACAKLVDCGAIAIDDVDENGIHGNDYTRCLDELSDEFTSDRLAFTLRCVEVSSCPDLSAGRQSPCFLFGDDLQ